MKTKFIKVAIILFSCSCKLILSQSLQDLSNIKKEFEKQRSLQQDITSQQLSDPASTGNMSPQSINIVPSIYNLSDLDTLEKIPKHFGYNFFTQRDTVSFFENLPPPKEYQIGPGDEVIVTLWGETQLRRSYKVNRDGNIYDEKVGLIAITGKNLENVKKYLNEKFSRIYSTLKSNNASTFIDVSLGQLKSININIVGEVNYPGVYPVHPFSNVITSLIYAGGVDTTGSLRSVKIMRNNENHKTIDFYSYLISGNLPKDVQLRDNDIIVVPPRLTEISIDSGVVRPGIYEFLPGETIKDVINYAGGLRPNSSSTIGIERITPIEKRSKDGSMNESYYIKFEEAALTLAQNGDNLKIKKIHINPLKVEVVGQVKEPGSYNFFNGMDLKYLISLSIGFNDTSFWKSIYPVGQLVRRNPDNRYETIINVNLERLAKGDETQNFKLQNLDKLLVHSNLNFFERKSVKISGEVNIPGSYPIKKDDEDLASLLERAGGLTSKALPNGITIYRDRKYFFKKDDIRYEDEGQNEENNEKVSVAWSKNTISLMPGDSIIVKESTKTVLITGEVQNPGLIEYNKGKSIRYYINAAGGVNDRGNKKSIILVEANGLVRPKKWYISPSVSDGSIIHVSRKEETQPFDITQFATNWTQIISSLITAVILSQQINQN